MVLCQNFNICIHVGLQANLDGSLCGETYSTHLLQEGLLAHQDHQLESEQSCSLNNRDVG